MKSLKAKGERRKAEGFYIAFFVFLFGLSFLFAVRCFAGGAGTVSGQFLKEEISPRAMGMGGAFVAIADDIYSIYHNPAGVGQIYMPEISLMHHSGFSDNFTNFAGFGMPLPFTGLAGLANPSAAVSYLRQSDGKFTYRYIDPATGNIDVTETGAETNSVLTLSYGEKVFSDVVNLEGYNADIMQFFGISAKYIRSTLLDKYSASALVFDAGYLAMEMNTNLAFGASLGNGGGKLEYYSESEPLPFIAKVGFSHYRNILGGQYIILTVQNDFYTQEKFSVLRFGAEYHFEEIFNLRIGYKTGDNKGLAFGLGLEHSGIKVDLGITAGNEVYNATQVAVSYKFFSFGGYKPSKNRPFREYKEMGEKRPEKKPSRTKPAPKEEESDFFWIY